MAKKKPVSSAMKKKGAAKKAVMSIHDNPTKKMSMFKKGRMLDY